MGKALIVMLLATITACQQKKQPNDASGTFEAVETIVSSEASGMIMQLDVDEGATLKAGQPVGYVDSTQLFLKKKQLLAQAKSVLSSRPNVRLQTAALEVQLAQAQREQLRTANLVKADAATQKQLDDATAQVGVLQKQITAQQSSLGITSSSISEQASPVYIQIQQVDDQLGKCRIINPINGTVLSKYAEVNEVTAPGKPVYKIAELSTIILRAYITGNQLAGVRIGQQVNILADNGKNDYRKYNGTIEWISDKAEFTPKTIQTNDERANLVYAMKVRVKNDGYLKIGMYGEIQF